MALLVLRSIDGDARILLLATLALAVDEELGLGMVGVHEDRGYLSFAPRPRPVGEDVKRLSVLVPVAAVEIEAILGDTCQVDSTEERGVAGPFAVVGGRLTEVIDTRPDEFAHAPVVVLLTDEVVLGEVAPAAVLDVVARRLMVGVLRHALAYDRELIHTARAHRGAGLRAEEEALRQDLVCGVVEEGTVVEARDVKGTSHTALQHAEGIVHAVGDGARGVFAVADLLQTVGELSAFEAGLLGDFVPDAPHDDRGAVAELVDEVREVTLMPLVEVQVVAVGHLGLGP